MRPLPRGQLKHNALRNSDHLPILHRLLLHRHLRPLIPHRRPPPLLAMVPYRLPQPQNSFPSRYRFHVPTVLTAVRVLGLPELS